MGIVNDGTKEYDHKNDGGRQGVGQCIRDFRNKPHPIRAKISYLDNVLTVFINQGLTAPDPKDPMAGFELCFRADNVYLPMPGHFGISAATGGLADDHDVLAFLVHELARQGDESPPQDDVPEAERERLSQKYQQLNDEVSKMKEDYKKEHPGKPGADLELEDDAVEDWAQRELRNIYQSQAVVVRSLESLNKKLDEMYGRQEQLSRSIYQMVQGGGVNTGNQQAQGAPPGLPQDGMKRYEVDQMLNSQRELQTELAQMKSNIYQLSQITQQANAGNQQQVGAGSHQAGVANQQLAAGIVELRDHIGNMRRVVDQIAARPMPQQQVAQPQQCPVVNCVGPAYFIVFIIAQFCIFVGFILFKGRNEKPKFY